MDIAIREARFRRECKVINLFVEYTGYTGDAKYAIITNLKEWKLKEKYEEIIEQYRPYIILSREAGLAIRVYERFERKYGMRRTRGTEISFIDTRDEDRLTDPLNNDESVRTEYEHKREERDRRVREALMALTPKQRERLIDHHINGMTLDQIAQRDGVSPKRIYTCIKRAENNFISAYENLEAAS